MVMAEPMTMMRVKGGTNQWVIGLIVGAAFAAADGVAHHKHYMLIK